MDITFYFLHSSRHSWDFNILCIICSSQRRITGPTFLIYPHTITYRSAALLFFKALIPFSKSTIWNGDASISSVSSCFFSLWDVVLVYFAIENSLLSHLVCSDYTLLLRDSVVFRKLVVSSSYVLSISPTLDTTE